MTSSISQTGRWLPIRKQIHWRIFGPYRIERRIDKGGMGRGLAGMTTKLPSAPVAIKNSSLPWPTQGSAKAVCEEVYNGFGKLEHRLHLHAFLRPWRVSGMVLRILQWSSSTGKPLDEYCRQQCSVEQRMDLFEDICEAGAICAQPAGDPSRSETFEHSGEGGRDAEAAVDFGIAKQLESLVEAVKSKHGQT